MKTARKSGLLGFAVILEEEFESFARTIKVEYSS
jgi:hypothetical protein